MFESLNDLPFPKSLGSDNHSGAHPEILKAITTVNQGHAHSYGMDPVSELTQKEFDRVFGKKTFVHYVFNGTAANVMCMTAVLKRFESVICSSQAHMHLDECGAPEVVGHIKLIPLESENGKISPEQAEAQMDRQGDQHHAQVKMVSLTQPTELGVCYSLEELRAWKKWCQAHNLYLHCDGTRLANSCVSMGIRLKDYAEVFDLISFGGSKNGLLGAEAVVSFNKELSKDFKFYRKQLLNLPSKTRFLAAQFYAYLKDDLYLKIADHVCSEAKRFHEELKALPEARVLHPVQSNALFVQFPKKWLKPLREKAFFYIWDSNSCVARLMVSFDWTKEDTDSFINRIQEVKKNVQLS